jgi:small subunit ribosomal protein S14
LCKSDLLQKQKQAILGNPHKKGNMAKTSVIARNTRRAKLIAQYAAKRAELKKNGDYEGLKKLPRDSSPTRYKNRCFLTGRGQAYMRDFGLSRIAFRELANEGQIPGVRKSSW